MSSDFVIVSNRMPVSRTDDGWVTSSGGLVTAMLPIAQSRPSSWVGWTGDTNGADLEPFVHDDVRYVPVELSSDEVEMFYEGFANAVLWPLYHDALRPPLYDHHWWHTYQEVNRRFAERVCATAAPGATVWVHDYQLHLVPGYVREQRPDLRIGFFLHIPFPPVELFEQLPWRVPLLEGTLGADVIGFQTPTHADNFARAVERLVGWEPTEQGLRAHGRESTVAAFPISIDVAEAERMAQLPEVAARAEELRSIIGPRRTLLLGVDRLDYTKGIDRRLMALYELLDQQRLSADEVAMVQVAVPSREDAPGYSELRDEVERLAGAINGRFSTIGGTVLHYLYRSVDSVELAALYRAADVMLVTPLRDGMNLVAKEYVAGHTADDGVLVLSEFAGAAQELESALLVNPFDERAVAGAIERAVRMPVPDRASRMAALRSTVAGADVHSWANSFLECLAGS